MKFAAIVKQLLKESEYQSPLDKQFQNNDEDISIQAEKVIKADRSGPYATSGTSETIYTVVSLSGESAGGEPYSDAEILLWAKTVWKASSQWTQETVKKVQQQNENEWSVYVEKTNWYN